MTFTFTIGFIFGGAGIAALTAITGIFGAISQYQASKNAAKQAEYDAEYEAEVREQEAEQERLNRREKEAQERRMTARKRASQRASYAKSGVLLEGTPAAALAEQAQTDELGIQQKNLESRQRQKLSRQSGQAALTAGKNKASALRSQAKTSLITGLGKTASNTYQSYNWWGKNG